MTLVRAWVGFSCDTTSVGDMPGPWCGATARWLLGKFPDPNHTLYRQIAANRLQQALYSSSNVCRALHHGHAGRRQSRHLLVRGALAPGDDRPSMPHAAPGRRRLTRDEAHHRLLEGLLDVFRGFLFGRAADLANHHHG